jgi:hypothetical protein
MAGAAGTSPVTSIVSPDSKFFKVEKTFSISLTKSSLDIDVPAACEETISAVNFTRGVDIL